MWRQTTNFMDACADELLCCSAVLCSPWYKFISLPSLPPSKSVFFGNLTSGIVFSKQEALKSVLILCSSILSHYCSCTLNWFRRISHFHYSRLQKSLHNTIQYEIPCGNQGLLTLNSDSWPQISYQTWVYWKPTHLSSWNASRSILRIYCSRNEISTRLINNQTHETKKKSIWSLATLHDSGNKFVNG